MVAILTFIISEKLDMCRIGLLVFGTSFACQKSSFQKTVNIININIFLSSFRSDTTYKGVVLANANTVPYVIVSIEIHSIFADTPLGKIKLRGADAI
ncbi:MAG: hypothetical protein WCR46_07530 [Deltaproteobacteria bacterium]